MREAVLRGLAARAASDPGFLSGIRKDPERTLAAYGYDLTPDELKTVLDLRRRTALLGNRTLAALLAGGLEKRTGSPPVRPASLEDRGMVPQGPARRAVREGRVRVGGSGVGRPEIRPVL